MIAWVDVESTGLDPREGSLLEIASVVTDDQLVEVARFHALVAPSSRDLDRMSDLVREIHSRNGLLEEVRAGGRRRFEVGELLRDFWDRNARGAPLGGSSVGFDRAWLREHLPEAEKVVHYRSVDVSSLKELARRWRPDLLPEKGEPTHRALPDVLASIEELRGYRDGWLMRAPRPGLTLASGRGSLR